MADDTLNPSLGGLASQAPVPYSSPTGAFITGLPTVGNRPAGPEWSMPLTPPQPQLPPRPQADPNRWFSPNLQSMSANQPEGFWFGQTPQWFHNASQRLSDWAGQSSPELGSILLARRGSARDPENTETFGRSGTRNFNLINDYGKQVGDLMTSSHPWDPETVHIDWLGSRGGAGSLLFSEGYESGLRELLREWPQMKRIKFMHVGGSGVYSSKGTQSRELPKLPDLPEVPADIERQLNEGLQKIIREQVIPNREVDAIFPGDPRYPRQGEILPPRSPYDNPPPRPPSVGPEGIDPGGIGRRPVTPEQLQRLRSTAQQTNDPAMVNLIDAISRARGIHPGGHGQESPLEPEE